MIDFRKYAARYAAETARRYLDAKVSLIGRDDGFVSGPEQIQEVSMSRNRLLQVCAVVALLMLTALSLGLGALTAAHADGERLAASGRPADASGCSAESVLMEPAYLDPDWWAGAIEYGFP